MSNLTRRDFMHLAAAAGLLATTDPLEALAAVDPEKFLEFEPLGNLTLLFVTDPHGHLKPHYYREPSINIGPSNMNKTPGHLTGEDFLNYYKVKKGSVGAYFGANVAFEELSKKYGKMGGYAHIATLVKNARKSRGADRILLLDGGDTWQGTAVAMWTEGKAMVEAQNLLGVDAMAPHWEFTYGRNKVDQRVSELKGDFLAQNIRDADWGEMVYPAYKIYERGGVKVAVIGQAFPYVPIAHPGDLSAGLTFGVQPERMQAYVNEVRDKKADVVVALSHNGLEVDKKLASQVSGIDFLISAHTHDAVYAPIIVGKTVVAQAGTHGKFLGRIDAEVKNGKVGKYRYKLIPVLSQSIEPDGEMQSLIDRAYAPYAQKLSEKLGVAETTLYRRDTFYGTFDHVIMESIRSKYDSEIVFSPGYRWGSTIPAGAPITMDDVYDMTAVTYPNVYTFDMKGEQLKLILEDVVDNVFNRDPYFQQGGDMSRLLGVTYDCHVNGEPFDRLHNVLVNGKPLEAQRKYKLSAWGGNLHRAGENLRPESAPVYDVVAEYIRSRGKVSAPVTSNVRVVGA
ncbi:MAG: thiosulfohydrolase SoxB [Nitrospinae bacterium]|nr:thiosulfohydrolase SoxB [Nitrospinota bacterium]